MFNCLQLKSWRKAGLLAALMAIITPASAMAQDGGINSGDTAWILVSSALVLLMTPGLAFFYAGMVRSKNVVSTLFQNMVALGVIGILWMVIGYSLAFVGDINGFVGGTDALMLNGVGQEANGTIPHLVFMAFQMMFAIITPILMTGAFAERVNFKSWVVVMAVWSIVVYSPVCHWVWGGGWLAEKGALDFAGGFVVHMTAGYSALVAAMMIGPRKDTGAPYDTGMVVLGTALLWFGWFGFNAGSALAADGIAAQAFVTTFASSAAAMLAWMFIDKSKDGKSTLMGACIGIVAGLVAVTPCAGFISMQSALIVGVLAGVICNIAARTVKGTFNIDDSLDVFACHGIGGTLGLICLGLFSSTAVNAGGADGLFNGSADLLQAQIIGIVGVAAYSMIATFIIIKVVGSFCPLRCSDADESTGLDQSQHGETVQHH